MDQGSGIEGAAGLFIVLEGVDGAGTTTQSHRLSETLLATGRAVHVTQQPSKGPVGMLLRQVLAGRLVIPAAGGAQQPSWSAMALMFAADRLDHLEAEVSPHLAAGETVVCDRYYHSSLAYQSMTGGASSEMMGWILEINRFARPPDLTVVLDVSARVAHERRRARLSKEIYERDDLQKELCNFYRDIQSYFPGEPIVHVDADRPFEEVAEAIFGSVQRLSRGGG